jgi:ABC-type multidrug transport system fused ATPase/permease subunit
MRLPTAGYLLYARLMWRSAPVISATCLSTTILTAGATTVAIIASGKLIGALGRSVGHTESASADKRALTWLIMTMAALAGAAILNAATGALAARLSARYIATMYDALVEVGVTPRVIADFDGEHFVGQLTAFHTSMQDWTFVVGVESTWSVLAVRLSGCGALAIVCTWHWWIGAAVVAGFLLQSRFFTSWVGTIFGDLMKIAGESRRAATYVRGLLTGGGASKEIRLFGLADFLLARMQQTWSGPMEGVWRRRAASLRSLVGVQVASLVIMVGAVAFLARDAVAGTVPLSDVAAVAQALLALRAFGPIGDVQTALARNLALARSLAAFRRTVGLPAMPEPAEPVRIAATAHERSPSEVRFRNVSFRYPSQPGPVLSNLSLTIPAGQSIGIVGLNGAGKSTLIKLLCGLYTPDEGTVHIGDAESATSAARRRVGVILQDFQRYPLSLRNNIAYGAGEVHLDDDAIRASLRDAGALGLLERADINLDTVLSAEYRNGTDLSGGQWQRVALARAFAALRAGAGVLVLDEPSAALDVRAEAALFNRFLEVTQGSTTLLVSHRLSSVRRADRIIVIGATPEGGSSVVEDGTHAELIAANGEYARLFALQASRFAEQREAAEPQEAR